MSLPIVYCMMTQNRLLETKHCLDLVTPYVDETVVVDGGSIDDSIFYLRNRDDVHMFIHPWQDNFPKQRTNYINRAREIMGTDDFWILVSDPDEWFSVEALAALYDLQDEAERRGANLCTFRCMSVTLKGNRRVWENLDEYWKGLFYRYKPGLKYIGNPHEQLVYPNEPLKPLRTELMYEHVKQENVIWHRGCRNMYIGGGGPNLGAKNAMWVELRTLVKDLFGEDLPWHEFEDILVAGNLPEELKDWLMRARLEDGYDGASEMRESYKLYFRVYHPEEEPEDIKGEHIQ